jgi:IBR domain, a half RING-finger domain
MKNPFTPLSKYSSLSTEQFHCQKANSKLQIQQSQRKSIQEIYMGGPKKRSSTADGADTDESGGSDKSSKHFQHLLQLVTSSVAKRGHASTRQPERKAGEAAEEGGSEPPVRKQVPLYERAQRHINKHIGMHQERPQSTHPESISGENILRGQDRQLGESIPSQQIGNEPEKPPPPMTSCFEKVAFELGQYSPKAPEIEHTCTICYECLPVGDFPAAPITSTCLLEFHRIEDESFVCKSCINGSIDAQLSVSKPDEFSCPSCKQRMGHQDIKNWTENEVFEKYDHMITLQAIQEDGSFIRCWRPECGGGQFHDGEAEFPIVICQECGAMTCYRHSGLPWHEGLTCDEFENPDTAIRMLQDLINDLKFESRVKGATSSRSQAQMTDRNTELESKLDIARRLRSERRAFLASGSDKLGAKTVAELTKRCPQCHSPVEKTGGCKHMKCRCGFEFCYGCLVPWNLAPLATPCSEEHDHADVLNLGRRQAARDPVRVPELGRVGLIFGRPFPTHRPDEEHGHVDVLNLARRYAAPDPANAPEPGRVGLNFGPPVAADRVAEEHGRADVLSLARRQADHDLEHALSLARLGRIERIFEAPLPANIRTAEAPLPRPEVPEAPNQPPWLLRHEIGFFEPAAPGPGPGPQPPLAQPRVPANRPQYPTAPAMQRDLDHRMQRASYGIAIGVSTQALMNFVRFPVRRPSELEYRHRFSRAMHEALFDPNLLHRAAHTRHLLHPPYPDLLPHFFGSWAREDRNEIGRGISLRILAGQYVEQGHVTRLSGDGILRWADQDFAIRLQALQNHDPDFGSVRVERVGVQGTGNRQPEPMPDLNGPRREFRFH